MLLYLSFLLYVGFCRICKCNFRNKSRILNPVSQLQFHKITIPVPEHTVTNFHLMSSNYIWTILVVYWTTKVVYWTTIVVHRFLSCVFKISFSSNSQVWGVFLINKNTSVIEKVIVDKILVRILSLYPLWLLALSWVFFDSSQLSRWVIQWWHSGL